MISRYFEMLRKEFSGYNGSRLTRDLLAGITVAAVALPLALAFGVSSGADAAAGLITAIIAGLIMSALAGGFYQISGPTGAMAAILMSVVAKYQIQGVFLATLMAGVLILIAGLLRLGRLTSFIPAPVITGFTSGIAVIIALGQVDNFFGVSSQGDTALAKLASYGSLGFSPNWAAVALGAFVVLFMVFYPKKWNSVVPASLMAIIIATAASMLLNLDVASVGAIPRTLFPENRLQLSQITLEQVTGLFSPAVSIALLGMIESLLCGASAGRMADVRMDSNQELIAQGVGNILLPFFGGIPATAAIARTSVAIKSGAQTRLTGVFHAGGLLLAMFVLGPVMSKIPLSALAGVLMVTAWRMNEWKAIRYIFSHKFKGPILKFAVTMIATVTMDLTMAIVIGVLVGMALFVCKSATAEVREGREEVDGEEWAIFNINGPLFFMTSEAVEQRLSQAGSEDRVVFMMHGVTMVDYTAVSMLMDFYHRQTAAGKRVPFANARPSVLSMLRRAGLAEEAGEEVFDFDVAALPPLSRDGE
ncbi:MAG: SulP family inorganic anion transporter [Oscillospiraceae bacterium]|nr:SulP family inorganic anion transporter [Oscillospiraceae bacterium]